jgi:ABC-type transporter MlaC component
MKKLTMLLAVMFAATLSYAGDKDKDTTKEIKSDVKDVAKDVKSEAKETKAEIKADKNTHEVEAEVVSIDSVKNTVTIKTAKGESTAPVEGKAQVSLTDLKPGQKVTVLCRDDAMGGHKAVTEIKTSEKK